MIKQRKLGYSAALVTLLAGTATAHAQDATIYYSQPTIQQGQPVRNAAPVINPVPVYTPAVTAADMDNDTSYLGQPQVQVSAQDQGVEYASGGIGLDEKNWFDSNSNSYALKATYNDSTGHNLAGVDVSLTDSAGKTVLNTVTEGPYLLVKAKPGSYTLTSNYEGQSKSQKLTLGKGTTRTNIIFTDSGL